MNFFHKMMFQICPFIVTCTIILLYCFICKIRINIRIIAIILITTVIFIASYVVPLFYVNFLKQYNFVTVLSLYVLSLIVYVPLSYIIITISKLKIENIQLLRYLTALHLGNFLIINFVILADFFMRI